MAKTKIETMTWGVNKTIRLLIHKPIYLPMYCDDRRVTLDLGFKPGS